MAQVYNKVYVDVNTKTDDMITAVQKDANSRFLDVYLKDNGLPINLTGHEVRIYSKKYDGTEIYNDGEITEAANGRCQFELTDQALALAQDLEVQIIIYYNNVQILQSLPFTIHVKKSLISNNAIESSNEYGALVVLYQNLYEAYDLMTTMVQNIGVPGEIAGQLTIDTMWDAWEYLCNYVSEDLTTLIQDAINNNSVDGVVQRIGETNDTGATESTGTVFGKLNGLLFGNEEINKRIVNDNDIISACTNYTTLAVNNWPSNEVEILNVTGKGVVDYLKIVCGYVDETATMEVYIDGELFLNFRSFDGDAKSISFGYVPSTAFSILTDLTPFTNPSDLTSQTVISSSLLSFAKSLRIVVNTEVRASGVVATVKYGIVG